MENKNHKQMHFLALGLSAALARGVPLYFDETKWVYGQHDECAHNMGWTCYFESLRITGERLLMRECAWMHACNVSGSAVERSLMLRDPSSYNFAKKVNGVRELCSCAHILHRHG